MSRKLTTEEIKEKIKDLTNGEYLLLGDYVNSSTKIQVKHNLCEKEYEVKWGDFQQGVRCSRCSGLEKLNNKEIDKRMYESTNGEYVRLGDYVNTRTNIQVKHILCQNKYEVTWNSFQSGSRCPKCFGNDKLNNQEIDKRMYELVGNEYVRLGDYLNSKTKILIKHNICENQYEVEWSSFQQGSRCSRCGGTEKLNNKEIDKRMFELVGNGYLRLGEYLNNKTKMLIKHNLCQNQYKVTWNNFQGGRRCPKCFGKEKLNNQEIDKKMYELVKDEYVRLGEYKGNHTKILIKHNLCGNTYEVKWNNFHQGARCPKCNESKGEKTISDILNSLSIKYTSQKRFPECKYKKTLPFDFYIHNKKSKLLIEFDGEQHFESIEYFGGEDGFQLTQLRDQIKNDFALSNNIPLLRIPYTEKDNIEQILTNKLKELNFI